jgi:hypothetical protein
MYIYNIYRVYINEYIYIYICIYVHHDMYTSPQEHFWLAHLDVNSILNEVNPPEDRGEILRLGGLVDDDRGWHYPHKG